MLPSSWATWLLLAVPPCAADVSFDWSVLQQWAYEVNDTQTDMSLATSIVDYSKVNTSEMLFQWHSSSDDFTFQSAILATGDSTVARGYISHSKEKRDPGSPLLQFSVFLESSSLSLDERIIQSLYDGYKNDVLFFQMGWKDSDGNEYGSSPVWAIAEDAPHATSLYNSLKATGTVMGLQSSVATAVFAEQTTPRVSLGPAEPIDSSATADAISSSSTSATSNNVSSNPGYRSKSPLSTGAVVGIAIGGLAFLILVSAFSGWLCLRHRRRTRDAYEARDHDAQAMQDMLAGEAAARAKTQEPDTPCSEDARSLGGAPGMAGPSGGGSSASVSVVVAGGTALRGADGSVSSSRRGSAAYSSLRAPAGGGGSPTRSSLPGSPLRERSSSSGPPSRRSSVQQQERNLGLHGDQPGQLQEPFAGGRTVSHNNSTSNLSNVMNVDDDDDFDPPSAVSQDSVERYASPPDSRTGTPHLGPTRLGRRSETPGGVSISDQYAFLVEDSMTEDEIRRLEEEERALDEAIEQHRTDSRTAAR